MARPAKERHDKRAKKRALQSRVAAGISNCILAYAEGVPMAWCSVGPRESFRKLPEISAVEAGKGVWAITCLFVARPFRGQGVVAALIDTATAYAEANGTILIEAYPVDQDSPSYRFMEFKDRFDRAGFAFVDEAGLRRLVMQRKLA